MDQPQRTSTPESLALRLHAMINSNWITQVLSVAAQCRRLASIERTQGRETPMNAISLLAREIRHAIRSLSKGRAAYSMEPFCFEQVPNSIVAGILDSAKGKPAARA